MSSEAASTAALTPLGLVLAGALLAELGQQQRIYLDRETGLLHALATRHQAPPEDALTHLLLEEVANAKPQPVRDWLRYLAEQAPDQVPRRLDRRWHMTIWVEGGRRRRGQWVPTDPARAAVPKGRLRHELLLGRPLSNHDVVLAGLAMAAGLRDGLLWATHPSSATYLAGVLSQLPNPLPDLVHHTEAAVGGAVVSHRV